MPVRESLCIGDSKPKEYDMRKLIVAVSAAAMLAASSLAAFAEEATGAITAIDPAAGTVTLADGNTYTLPTPEDAASLQVGQEVTITFEEGTDGSKMATEVVPAG
jgi:Cu/Ag efflux protein CusF